MIFQIFNKVITVSIATIGPNWDEIVVRLINLEIPPDGTNQKIARIRSARNMSWRFPKEYHYGIDGWQDMITLVKAKEFVEKHWIN